MQHAERNLALVMVKDHFRFRGWVPRKRGVSSPPRYPVHLGSIPRFRDEKGNTNMKRITIALLIAVAALALAGCATAQADAPEEKPAAEFAYVHDWAEPKEPNGMVRIKQEMDARAAESQSEAPIAEQVDSQPEYWEGTAYSGPYDPELDNNPAYLNGGVWGSPDGLNSFNGVYDYNGHHETFYASHAAYDDQLWVDDEGFFRDDQGRYVVASSDYEHGTEIEISQGTAVVMDGGCEPGTVDVHTTWGR